MLSLGSSSKVVVKCGLQKRYMWQWLNLVFNRVDEERRKQFGADRTCAEWLLRNGAKVKWVGTTDYLADYNQLPTEGTTLHIQEVDATESSIMHYGFPHFVGCKHIQKIILHDCGYIQDEAMGMMDPLTQTLNYLQVSSCANVTSKGLNSLVVLKNLHTLILFNLPYVSNKEEVVANIKAKLPECNVTFK